MIQKIENKKFKDKVRFFDVVGNKYPVARFGVDELRVGPGLSIYDFDVYEENVDFVTKDLPGDRPKSWYGKFQDWVDLVWIDGSIGWPIFTKGASLFDFPHSAVYLAKDLKILEEEGVFSPDCFIKVPIELTEFGFVLIAQTERGSHRFLLDTGASHSIYRDFEATSRTATLLTVNVDGHDLGEWEFIFFPFTTEFSECDGIIGIEFFQAHEMCFDVEGKSLYLRKVL